MTLIEKGFEGKYGIKVEYWRADATKVIDRVLTEWRAGKPGFDIVIGARGALYLARKKTSTRSLFRPTPPISRRSSKTRMVSSRPGAYPVGVLYNTELVKAADVPRSSRRLARSQMARED